MRFTLAYTILFIYVVVAIIFWGYSLHQKSEQIYRLEKEKIALLEKISPNKNYTDAYSNADDTYRRRAKQYWGEGSTFLLIILVSAVFVYLAFYRQIRLSKLQRNFMMSVTHELKTPLAGIILNLQTLLRRKLGEDVQLKLLQSSEMEAKRLSELCNNILIATQLEDGEKSMDFGHCDLIAVVGQTVQTFSEFNKEKELHIDVPNEIVEIKGDENLWQLIISNLLENAKKYSPIETAITVSVYREGKDWVLAVKDEGQGIAPDDKKKIFNKFYRVGNEETRKTKGTGIGLFLVKKLVEMFKYDISVKDNKPAGSIFEVRFK